MIKRDALRPILSVVCLKAPPAYTRMDVVRLERMVARHLTIPYRFYCVTNDHAGLSCRTKHLPSALKGWWGKLYLHKLGLFGGPVLYLDLDTLIVDNIDFVADYKGDFAILRDFYRPDGYGSGVMLWNTPQPHVWDLWFDDPVIHPLGDQGIMEICVPNADRLQDLWPEKFVSFKESCQEGIPKGAAVVCFHGAPKPAAFADDHWVSRIWKHGEQQRA